MNQQKRKLVAWSPHDPSNFVVGANDLRLFQVKFKNGFRPSSALKFSMDQTREGVEEDKKTISLLSINAEVQFLKCLAWSPSDYDPNLIAAGLANGKTVLTSFSSVNRITKEFVPRHSRSCNAVAWNPFYKNQLACGLDKVRGDFSTIVWDVTHGSMPSASPDHFVGRFDNPHSISQRDDNQFNLLPQEAASTVVEPIHELANSETTLALAWVPNSPSCLAAGTGAKWLRIYDLRGDINAPRSVMAHTKAVSGVCFDFFDYNRLATFSEDSIVKVWDLRKLVEPTLTINTNAKAIQQIDWCPTRSGVLATIFKDGNSMKIWDVKEYAADSSRNGALITKPSKTYYSPEIVSSFAWHPSNECRMLIISPNTMAETVSLNETIPLSFSPHSDMCFSYGTHFVTGPIATPAPAAPVASPGEKTDYVDISVLMKQRALQGYSASIEENKTLSLLFNDKGLQFLWTWASTINTIVKKGPTEFTGIYSVLHEGYVPPPPTMINWGDSGGYGIERSAPGVDKSGFFTVYKSPQRTACLEICGWVSNSHVLEAAIAKLEREGEFERAAAMAVFHLDVRRAVTALNRGSSSSNLQDKEREFNLRLVAVALAGFSESQAATNQSYYNNSLWRETCASMSSQYKHPYLSACFGFLCNEIQSVLDMQALTLRDRIAVACKYLNNEMLMTYIERVQQQSIDSGDLAGVIITGLTHKGVDLFQRYVDRTGDVQSASLAMGLVVPSLFKDSRVARWNSAYRELLDNWQLWHERALLDIRRGSPDSAPRPQVYARCNYCNQSLSLGVLAVTGTRFAVRGSAPGVKHIVNSCPSCKKPLPRCSLCLLNLNCSLPTYDRRSSIPPPLHSSASLHSSSSSHPSSSGSLHHSSSSSAFPPPSPYANKHQPPSTPKGPPPPALGASAGPVNTNAAHANAAHVNAGNANSNAGNAGEEIGEWTSGSNAFDEWFSWCQTCRHGGHAKHLLEWFSVHAECPVTDCTCKCCSI